MESGPVAAAVAAAVAAVAALQATRDALAALDVDALTHPELLTLLDHLETDTRRTPVLAHRIINRLAAEANPLDLGATSLPKLLAFHLRISHDDARARMAGAADLGPRRRLTGEPITPALANTAAGQAAGRIGGEQVKIIRKFFTDLPDAVDHQARDAAEADLARLAGEHGPEGLRRAAALLAALLHPDGDYTDNDRARRRGLTVGNQQADGMSRLSGWLTPEARATWEAVSAKLGAPGMCNPEDAEPCLDAEPTDQHTGNDTRSVAQRHHDAFLAMGRSVLCSGELGQHRGLPVTIIVSTTLQELESGAGHAITAGGTRLPMPDVIRLASFAFHYLVVFDKHTGAALYLGRTRRCASAAQRIVLLSRERGCTRPGCTATGYQSQVHHAVTDWKNGGHTDIDDLTLACGPDNRLIENTDCTTRKRPDGRTEWIPPPHLDTGQARINNLHHPENMLLDREDE